jgi:hypothetical protein
MAFSADNWKCSPCFCKVFLYIGYMNKGPFMLCNDSLRFLFVGPSFLLYKIVSTDTRHENSVTKMGHCSKIAGCWTIVLGFRSACTQLRPHARYKPLVQQRKCGFEKKLDSKGIVHIARSWRILGFHGRDYAECRLLGYETLVRTSQVTH